ncbi:hypothetical protein AB0M36_26935 [Actinoplanes sp. NPDC051346]|uniref:hypothetical protein n=1 Tax=Actinoplanes sp. NPDC051346 TaxID=3155048 RepID=UPI003417F02C
MVIDVTGWTVLLIARDGDIEDCGWIAEASSAARELRHFGIAFRLLLPGHSAEPLPELRDVAAAVAAEAGSTAPAGTYLLGGPLHGWHLPPSEPGQLGAVVELVRRYRLGLWRDLMLPAPALQQRHKPGSDSTGVVQFEVNGPVVAKIGPRAVIESESRFVAEANARMAAAGRRTLFPEVYAVDIDGEQATSLMEAAVPVSIDQLFADEAKTRLAVDATTRLEAHLASLAEWYRLTAEANRQPTVADYLYRGRFTKLRENPAFRFTFGERFPGAILDAVLDMPVVLPGGDRVDGYSAATRWLDTTAKRLLPTGGSTVHGDIYMTNMLQRTDGSPVFIDPRTVWDGVQRTDPGFGDPVFDLATLLHGVLPMAAILHAVGSDRSEQLLDLDAVDLGAPELDLSSLTLPVGFSEETRALEQRLRMVSPLAEPEPVVRARLYIGAAASLAGWLKYDRSLRTPESWLATYAFLVWYLSQAKAVCAAHNLETT